MTVMTMFIAVIVLSAASCQRQPALPTARFDHVPSAGWLTAQPLAFTPLYADSTATYDLTLAVRHNSSYRYCNLALTVDIVAADSTVTRKALDIPLADEYGNWSSGGFGALYQAMVPIASGVTPDKARKVLVWQTMAGCDTLHGVTDVGIIASPQKAKN